MKRLLLLLTGILLFLNSGIAQERSNDELNFYYIAHDRKTNVQRLSHELQRAYDNLKEYDNAGIFYLANGEEPIIVKVNLPDENEKDFPHLIGEMQEKLAHDIFADYDIDRILDLFTVTPFVNDNDELLYNQVNWNYYITSNFWTMMYNESIISTLYWTFDMDQLSRNQEFYMNIIRSPEDEISTIQGQEMGLKNLSGINEKIAIVTY